MRVEEQSHARVNMSDVKWTIGIESTAHTFSFGLVDPNGIPYPSVGDTIKPLEGGIHPREVQIIIAIICRTVPSST